MQVTFYVTRTRLLTVRLYFKYEGFLASTHTAATRIRGSPNIF